MSAPLPKGQRARNDFPRFGLAPYAYRFPRELETARLRISGDVIEAVEFDAPLAGMPRVEHGAPLRVVAPAHYGYKSLKHLSRLEFHRGRPKVKPAAFAFMDHPRASPWRSGAAGCRAGCCAAPTGC